MNSYKRCGTCGFTWDPETLSEDKPNCRECEAQIANAELGRLEELIEEAREEIFSVLGEQAMPATFKHAVQVVVSRLRDED